MEDDEAEEYDSQTLSQSIQPMRKQKSKFYKPKNEFSSS